jgi:predicted ATPase
MDFKKIGRSQRIPGSLRECFVLKEDNWDDFGFQSIYDMSYVDSQGIAKSIGHLHIGEIGQESGRASVPTSFTSLGNQFFSLGGDELYYDNVRLMGEGRRVELLSALRDVAFDEQLLYRVKKENVFATSFLRSKMLQSVYEQFHRIAHGGVRNSPFDFKYFVDAGDGQGPEMRFRVDPHSLPPTNIHAIIGRNGVGKSHLLHRMANALASGKTERVFEYTTRRATDDFFTNVITVAFSAFDAFTPAEPVDGAKVAVRYNYVGLKQAIHEDEEDVFLSPKELEEQFVESLLNCRRSSKDERWRTLVSTLHTDPVFRGYEIDSMLPRGRKPNQLRIRGTFKKLSSGHKIVLLTVTRLVELVSEKSLVLIDEPESHLHPPLISSLVRTLSRLMTEQNGIALIATHSPVVLQEVPRCCTWVLRRSGFESRAQRPRCETFGQNISTLTHEVFGLEAMKSGFYSLLEEQAASGSSWEVILDRFDNQVGSDARAALMAILATKNTE